MLSTLLAVPFVTVTGSALAAQEETNEEIERLRKSDYVKRAQTDQLPQPIGLRSQV